VTVPAERIRRAAAAGAAGDIDLRLAASSDYSLKVAKGLFYPGPSGSEVPSAHCLFVRPPIDFRAELSQEPPKTHLRTTPVRSPEKHTILSRKGR
jgi:hypothetical protein